MRLCICMCVVCVLCVCMCVSPPLQAEAAQLREQADAIERDAVAAARVLRQRAGVSLSTPAPRAGVCLWCGVCLCVSVRVINVSMYGMFVCMFVCMCVLLSLCVCACLDGRARACMFVFVCLARAFACL